MQKQLFECFTEFFAIKIAVAPVAHLLTEVSLYNSNFSNSLFFKVFCDNVFLCKNISQANIKGIFTLVITEPTSEYYNFYTALETLMTVYVISVNVLNIFANSPLNLI